MRKIVYGAVIVSFLPLLASAEANPYVRLDLGGALPTKLKGDDYGSKKPSNSLAFGLGAGYKFDENFRLDLNYLRANNFKFSHDLTIDNVTSAVSQKFHSNIAMLNAYFDVGNYSGFTPYLTAGIGIAHNVAKDYEVAIKNTNSKSLQKGHKKNNFAWNIGAGASFQLVENTYIDLGYKFYHLGKATTSSTYSANGGASTESTPISTSLRAHAVTVGLRYTF
ncbi:outer membrane protein [endosymbiont of Acanthamoeba sp. UWC8]|uniref:outer membrane protein n=1 Tax=endosymbiont of Acanthamoeba sp. UWC8 TaxID=86106 RepID=UPI00130DD498|nr:outer membrane beta-barrel protein [endosymbiont of Acanthamoeba sp. UWC8]